MGCESGVVVGEIVPRPSPTELAWLAGFWDGEGSVGITISRHTYILNAQMSHTDRPTVIRVLALFEEMGVGGRGYTFQEHDSTKHRDAHHVRVTGTARIRDLGLALLPYAVTKRRHWELAIEWADSRIAVAGGIDAKGHLFRGRSACDRQYSQRDVDVASELHELNRKGPLGRAPSQYGRIVV